MNPVVLDAATREKLLAGDVVEVRDEAGNLIGRFLPSGGKPTPPGGVRHRRGRGRPTKNSIAASGAGSGTLRWKWSSCAN